MWPPVPRWAGPGDVAAARLKLRGVGGSRRRRALLVAGLLLLGLIAVIAAVLLVVLLVLGRSPTAAERTMLAVSMIAAAIAALLYQPLRTWLERVAGHLAPPRDAPGDVLAALRTGLSRAIPLDELLLELAQSLGRSLRLSSTEVWTGAAGLVERVTSDPDRGWASFTVTPSEEAVIARTGVSGPGWLEVWLPAVLDGRGGGPLRVAPMANGSELLGLVVAERPPGGEPFRNLDERILTEFARQVGLALHNVRLDSQLEATLTEVKYQTEQLRISRARVVSAADAGRRRIERNLHDGAQQQLVALCANVRLARELAKTDLDATVALLKQLDGDVQALVEELRELAHGIYPPLLADRGLGEALSAVAARGPVIARLDAAAVDRYPPEVESTVYFCCLEALQNTAKHAGENASATVRLGEAGGRLVFQVSDDGRGFDSTHGARGAGLANMTDRLGAIGGTLRIESAPGGGARITGTIPLVR